MTETDKGNKKTDAEVMIGNYAIARGFVEAGIELAAAYPGTPSSEILPGIVEFKQREKMDIHTEWSVNERCALEVAFGAALSGHKAVCMMKQVGLNVAFPGLLKGRKRAIKGAFVIVSCDDPGPQSSQTEQDTRLLATLFDIPVFDPASPAEAADVAYYAVQYSSEHKVPVIIRPTHRVSHAREAIPLYPIGTRTVALQEGIQRPFNVQCSTFNVKTEQIKDTGRKPSAVSFQQSASSNSPHSSGSLTSDSCELLADLGIVASGMSCSIVADVLSELGLAEAVPLYKVLQLSAVRSEDRGSRIEDREAGSPPDASLLAPRALRSFFDSVDKVLVLEETDMVIEAIIGDSKKTFGRRNGYVPAAGELTYDVIRDVIARVANETKTGKSKFVPDLTIEDALKSVHVQPRPPKLCAGCPHRASFYAMRRAFPGAVFPGDIGCYTLGITMGAVDTCVDMGSGVTLGAGFYDAFRSEEKLLPIVASIGDSTFFHACLPPLHDAVSKNKRFILIIMDNGTTAMTGMQPTPQTGITVDGLFNHAMKIEDVVKGLGVKFLRVLDPYDIPLMVSTIREAYTYLSRQPSADSRQPSADSHQPPADRRQPSAISRQPSASTLLPPTSSSSPHGTDGSSNVEHRTLNVEQVLSPGPAVIIARRECILNAKLKPEEIIDISAIEKDCIGCKQCIIEFECPALVFDEETKKVRIDDGLCIQCGMCLYACHKQEKGKKLQKQFGKHTTKPKPK
ncbi:MAG TPA: thiamine pyrophosphate-dependent enzyme [Syntrophorhabdaceae bacterium]|nr:thiamine pyrophosphate-dependent enzyme [Syntrophorhabdaceae bacterium]HQM82467.1 thiamine pyrophosphate-dependent enzyme [Syntrophorhabdaceae bacterium]